MDRAAARPQPIPVYAEMGSLNPVVLDVRRAGRAPRRDRRPRWPARSATSAASCAPSRARAVPDDAEGAAFATALTAALDAREPEVLLNAGIHGGLRAGLDALDGAAACSA